MDRQTELFFCVLTPQNYIFVAFRVRQEKMKSQRALQAAIIPKDKISVRADKKRPLPLPAAYRGIRAREFDFTKKF